MLSQSTLVRNTVAAAAAAMIDAGSANPTGYIEFRTGNKPTNPQVAAPGTKLATLQFGNPAYGTFSNGRAAVNPLSVDENILATGTCGWFRIYDKDGRALWDGRVTVIGGGGDIEFDTVEFIQGGTVQLLELDAVMPE